MTTPRVKDNDRDEITVTLDGKEIRGWSYENDAERRTKMLCAREFVEGWFQATEHIVTGLDAEAECLPCSEDAAVTRGNAALVRANFSYDEAERIGGAS